MLRLVCAHDDQLGSTERTTLVRKIGDWLQAQPDQRLALASNITRLSALKAADADQLVRRIIDAERQEQEPAASLELLVAAGGIRGKSNSRASKRLDARLEELESGDEPAQELAQQARERLGIGAS